MENKYEYFLFTWGGFYNKEHVEKHGFTKGGKMWFDTKEDRDNYIKLLDQIAEKHNAKHLVRVIDEGYDTREVPTCHRIVEYKGKYYYDSDSYSWPTEVSTMEYHMEWKWTPGFNSYPLGEDFEDYENVNTVMEWITGARR